MIWYLIFTAWNSTSGGYVSNVITVPSARACHAIGQTMVDQAGRLGMSQQIYKCVGVRDR